MEGALAERDGCGRVLLHCVAGHDLNPLPKSSGILDEVMKGPFGPRSVLFQFDFSSFESFESFVIFVNIIELPVTARTLMFHHTCRPQSEVHFSALPDLGPSCAFVGQFFHTRSRVGGQTFCQCCLPLLKNLQEFRAKFLPTQVFQQSKEDHTGKRLYLLTIGYKRRPPNAGFEIKSPQA